MPNDLNMLFITLRNFFNLDIIIYILQSGKPRSKLKNWKCSCGRNCVDDKGWILFSKENRLSNFVEQQLHEAFRKRISERQNNVFEEVRKKLVIIVWEKINMNRVLKIWSHKKSKIKRSVVILGSVPWGRINLESQTRDSSMCDSWAHLYSKIKSVLGFVELEE